MANKYFYLNTERENCTYLQNDWVSYYGALKPTGVVLHDSASEGNAEHVAKYTVSTLDNANYHNVVDADGNCFAVIPMTTCAYHTGTQVGNKNYLGIEIAHSLTGGDFNEYITRERYHKAWLNGCKMVADYLVYFNISIIKFHQDFKATSCPYTMVKYFGSRDKAMDATVKQVNQYIKTIKGEETMNYWEYGKVIETINVRYGDRVLIEFTGNAGIFLDKNFTQQSTSRAFSAGEKVMATEIGWDGKYFKYSFISTNGRTYYFRTRTKK